MMLFTLVASYFASRAGRSGGPLIHGPKGITQELHKFKEIEGKPKLMGVFA